MSCLLNIVLWIGSFLTFYFRDQNSWSHVEHFTHFPIHLHFKKSSTTRNFLFQFVHIFGPWVFLIPSYFHLRTLLWKLCISNMYEMLIGSFIVFSWNKPLNKLPLIQQLDMLSQYAISFYVHDICDTFKGGFTSIENPHCSQSKGFRYTYLFPPKSEALPLKTFTISLLYAYWVLRLSDRISYLSII